MTSPQPSTCDPPDCDLSIIIVNWSTRELLAECLEALERSNVGTLERWNDETFVVDNASTDGSAAMVREQFPWVQLIENAENVGFARANNQALRQATGRYMLLLNSDTVMPEGALESLVAFGDAYPHAGVVGARLINPDGSFQAGPNHFPTLGSVILESWDIPQRVSHNPYYPSFPPERSQMPLQCDWVGGACLLARRTAVEQVGLLDERFYMNSEEVDWCYRMKQRGWEVWYTPTATVVHTGGASAKRSTAAQRLRTYRGKVLFLAKHHSSLAGWLAQIHFRASSLLKALAYATLFVVRHDPRHRDAAASHWIVMRETHWLQES